MKKSILIFFIFLLTAMMFSCSEKPKQEVVPTDDGKLTIGFSMGSLMEDRWVRDREILLSKARDEGIDVIVTNANGDTETQVRQVKEMIEQGIDVLLIAPNNSKDCIKCAELAQQKNIPVIAYDRLIFDANVDAYVTFDNYQVGALMTRELIKNVPKGGYVIVNGDPNDSNCADIRRGIYDVLHDSIVNGDITVLAETSVPHWLRETAYDFMVETIQQYGDKIDAVVVANDSIAWGVSNALSEAQINGVQVSGQDADLVACRRVVQGQQAVTIYKPIKDLVAGAVDLCKRLANGEPANVTESINDGTYEVPYKTIAVKAVTKENMEQTVIADGFHLREEVYKTGISE